MKSKGHVYMANVMIACLKDPDCQIVFPDIQNPETYPISPYVKDCILRFPSCFRAGAVGPDFFPDLVFGQMTIHATKSGIWIDRMMDELKLLPANTQEHQKAVSFFAGYMMHYAGDMFTHDYINEYALGWFPSYGEVIQNLFSYDVDWEEASKDYSAMGSKFKDLLPTPDLWNKLKSKLPEFGNSLETFLSVDNEKTILQNRYQELMTILGNLFSKENAQKDLNSISNEMKIFLERLYANPFTVEELDENLPDLKQILESFSGYQELENLKAYMPKLGQSLKEVFSFRSKRQRLELGYARLLESIENSFSSEEIINWMNDEFPQLWECINKFYEKHLLKNRLKGIEQAKIIIRHVLVEKYMDDYIDKQIAVAERVEERTLEIPLAYVRRCFASEDAIRLVEKEKSDEDQKKDKIISILGYNIRPAKIGDTGFLENYLKYYTQLYEGEGTSDQNLAECNTRINTWLKIWKNIAEHSMQVGTFKAFDLYGKELMYHFVAFFTEQEDERRRIINTIEGFDTFFGILDCDIPILSKLISSIKEGIKNYLKSKFYPAILDPAKYISKKPESELSDFDKSVAAIKEKFQSVKPLLEDEFLFGDVARKFAKEKKSEHETDPKGTDAAATETPPEQTDTTETNSSQKHVLITNKLMAIFGKAVLEPLAKENTGISKKLESEWKNLGATVKLSDIECIPFKNACLMGYLCLMDPHQLNKLMQHYDPSFLYFKSAQSSIGIGGFIVSLKTPGKKYAKGISSVRLKVHETDDLFMSFRVELTEKCFQKDGEIRIPLPAKRTIPLETIQRFELILNEDFNKFEQQIDCSIYDSVTNLLLAQSQMTTNSVTINMKNSNIKDDFDDTAHKAKIDNLRVEIKTGNNGTDGTIHFIIVNMNGSRQDVELDKSLYNDFEADHLDSYVVKLNIPLSIDEISHFEIIRDGGFDWQMAYVKVFSLESGDYLAGNDQTQLVDEDIPVLIQKDQKWETKPTNTWHAPIQNGKLTVNKLTITIKTSDDFLSGTNDDVFFHIHYLTDAGAQAELTTELDTDWHDDFEMDQIDSYDYQLDVPIPLDKFLYFEIKKKGKDDWVIDWIKVCDADSGKQIAAVESQHKIESDEGYIRINVK